MVRRLIPLVVVAALMSIDTASAQEGALTKLYGQGVHAFFNDDYALASRTLTQAIESGSQDPRCYYFRGLSRLRLGQRQGARDDFKTGARLESRATARAYDVNLALERVQGRSRLTVERFRTAGRVDALAESRRVRQLRYENLRDAETEVLRPPLPDTLVAPSPGDSAEDTPPLNGDAASPAAGEGAPFDFEAGEVDLPAPVVPPEETAPADPNAASDTRSAAATAIENIDTSGVDVPAETLQGVLMRALSKALSDGEDAEPIDQALPFDFPADDGGGAFDFGDEATPLDEPDAEDAGDAFQFDDAFGGSGDEEMPDDAAELDSAADNASDEEENVFDAFEIESP